MKTLAYAIAFAVSFPFSVSAQQSSSQASTSATSGATNQGNAQSINFNTPNGSGTSTVRSAPSFGGTGFYGSFSSDSCMVSGGGGGSVVGFGLSIAAPIEDQKCSLRRNFERTMQAAASTKDPARSVKLETAAVDILCQTDDRTRAALSAQGLCTDLSKTTADHVLQSSDVLERRAERNRQNAMYSPG